MGNVVSERFKGGNSCHATASLTSRMALAMCRVSRDISLLF